ncbi:methionine biosynthesis protein MetW [Sandarakinorhabdus cyanobacteriorum]|uniref:Methionine biosynthesis protein MetW n=1 Tax=Sandarakinorhabdus cyanobacteriorum TaxID=1981098 RepID=A0A255YPA8_9SPHN|nr:methionine biosynthesis protein MetW [Sandarakinorhabdus cyanobacteriorum]OYQ31056.1 methionine biosynthesis protein MetW [Sandarakinorhabdus cyanobacteriorum]
MTPIPLRPDLAAVAAAVPEGARVLDIGCGNGQLLAWLRDTKGVEGRGIELDAADVASAVGRGLAVVQGDADTDLADYPDAAFDVVILSNTLQAMQRPAAVLAELVRIGRSAIVSFPNFGHWRVRLSLTLGGRMPVTRSLPVSWHETPNIHFCTIADFEALAAEMGLTVERATGLSAGRPVSLWSNLLADTGVFVLRR